MKHTKKSAQSPRRGRGAALTVLALIVAIVVLTRPAFDEIAGQAVLLSAGLLLPEGGVTLLHAPPPEEDEPDDGGNPVLLTPGSSDPMELSSEASSRAPETPSETSVSSPPSSYTAPDVPEDQRGPIVEEKFTGSGIQFKGVWIKNTTGRIISIKDELEKLPDVHIKKDQGPMVLIMHTHTTESYELADRGYYDKRSSPRTTDNALNMVRVGDEIAAQLEAAGIGVIHDTTVHDYPQYNGSYKRSAETVKAVLQKYPGIQVVLDIHRDAIGRDDGTRIKPTTAIQGKKAAQIMIIAGCEGENIVHPDWELNLRLALRIQQNTEQMYPGLARPLKFMNANYNQSLTHGSLLIEIGSDSNTLEEAVYTGGLMGRVLAQTLGPLT